MLKIFVVGLVFDCVYIFDGFVRNVELVVNFWLILGCFLEFILVVLFRWKFLGLFKGYI